MASGPISAEQSLHYQDQGYTLARGFFDSNEIDLLRRAAKEDRELDQHSYARGDGEGGKVRMSLWNHPGDTIYGMFARCESVVNSAEILLGGEVYHYHSKMIMKDAKVGGSWAWHQDYGYWYQNGVLSPLLTSVFIAVDPATRENGCMQVIPGSHHLVHVEMEPGDALFFHSNLLHRSDQNRSENPRWSMICCYNAARNDPYKDSHHPRYTRLEKVPDSAILAAGLTRFGDTSSEVAWLQPDADLSATSLSRDSQGNQ
jgi:ectoine hydroxylase